jgi:hypothetical protein
MANFFPTNELAGIHWLKSLTGIPADKVAIKLPDVSKWHDTGFVTLDVSPAGQPDMYVPWNNPQFDVYTWAADLNSGKPPWRKANNLAQIIVEAQWDFSTFGRIQTPAQYRDVHVASVTVLRHPTPALADDARFAVYLTEITMTWRRVE